MSDILLPPDDVVDFTITLASLAAGSARQSDMVSNSVAKSERRPAALVYLEIQSGTAPTADTVYNIFLLRGNGDGSYRTDGAGASDAAITILNAQPLGAIVVTNDGNTSFYGDFDTGEVGALGDEWGIAVRNDTDQDLNSTESNHDKSYQTYRNQIQ